MRTINDLLEILNRGQNSAMKAERLYELYQLSNGQPMTLDIFKRKLRNLASEARKQGNRVIGDEAGYYIALTHNEWNAYKGRRFAAIREELTSFANCERLSVRDLIKEVYAVNVENPNYELNLQ